MKNLEGKSAVVYRRVSTTDQKDYANSLNEQKHRLNDFCATKDIEIVKDFEEDYSAKDFNRPRFDELLDYITKNHKKVDYILVHKWDRFARNVHEALGILHLFRSLSVEVNSIDQWIEHDDPSQFMLLLINLGLPDLDNRVRSDNVISGNRCALKEGGWINSQPKGYIPGKDEFGKTLMKPDQELAPLVTELFEEFATGNYSQNELRKSPKYSLLRLTRSNMSRMLNQIAYAGKIRIKGFKEEPEIIVDALHKPLITMETYDKVQYQLGHRRRYKQKANRLNENLPLSGFLQCSKCGGNLTGSGSKSKTGKKHYYYHCNTRKGCKTRFRVDEVRKEFMNLMYQIVPNDEVCALFRLILDDYYETLQGTRLAELNKVKNDIKDIETKKDLLMEKLLSGIIKDEDYQRFKIKMDRDLSELKI